MNGDRCIITDETGGRLGRHLNHDVRNREFPVRGVLFAQDAPIVTKTWWRRGVFDQGSESSCTMQAAVGCLVSLPFRDRLSRENLTLFDSPDERFAAYKRSQDYDPWDGHDYDGASTDAPYKLLRAEGHITGWRWCFGLDDVLRTLSHVGPVSMGSNWHEGMEEPDVDGFVHPIGRNLGGHDYELVGCNVRHSYVTAINSWSSAWGRHGRFRISFDDLDALLEAQGDAAVIVV